MKKMIANALVTGILVMAAGTTPVFADGDSNTTESVISEAQVQTNVDTPALIPGDVFYFIKTVVEKIELTLTFGDVKDALLLAEHAQERIQEANVLIAEGSTELAASTLQKAVDNQRLAVERGDLGNEEDTDSNEAESDEAESDDDEKVSGLLKQNIASLILAMEKVDNPKAKAALSKNIEKSFGKLAVKAANNFKNDVSVQQPVSAEIKVTAEEETQVKKTAIKNEVKIEKKKFKEKNEKKPHQKAKAKPKKHHHNDKNEKNKHKVK